MRPANLTPLFAPAQSLDGIGPRVAKLLVKVLHLVGQTTEPRVIDLLWQMPTGVIDRRARPSLAEAVPGTIATLRLDVLRHQPRSSRRSRTPHRVLAKDETGEITLVFFHGDRSYIERQLPVGATRYVSGRVERYGDRLQMVHPDHIVSEEDLASLPLIESVYPLTAGLAGKTLSKAMTQTLERVPELPEWQDADWLAQNHWPDMRTALIRVHRPQEAEDVSTAGPYWQRLAYDELLSSQLALALVREAARSQAARSVAGDGSKRARILAALPFTLTDSQNSAIAEIEADMAASRRMLRLLQGDVGSGKTIVALMAMGVAVEAGAQAAFMAPTEVLARQHFETIRPLAAEAGLTIALLTGREKGRPRKQVLSLLEDGGIDILIGTHALFQSDVVFHDLALAVIDEQHRFGVQQRLALQRKGGARGADVLVMTATPIPRTLLMTHYGDLDVSRLTEKPAGRKPVITSRARIDRLEEVFGAIARTLDQGAQIYWVCPLVESSDKIDLAAAEERAAHLAQHFGDRVALVHGQMPGPDKDAAMAAFARGEKAILVSTTVIEVGVDVANASVMVIEHAECFGLAQLHQLRGRVGRGGRQSYCILLFQPPLTKTARARLETMASTEDGFVIAEEDLRLRGGGEVLGTRQSGVPEFRLANVPSFETLIEAARDDAKLIMSRDAGLASKRGEALRTLLYLFDRDEAVRLFRAA